MTWEETILYIRKQPEFSELVKRSYLEENLPLNVQRYSDSEEFKEILKIISIHAPHKKKIADIGAGNGVVTIALSQRGFEVTAIEPDESDIVGYQAILRQKQDFMLNDLTILQNNGEKIPVADESFDIVFVRQALHHSADLNKFLSEAARVLRKGGLFLAIREHVIFNEKDKQWFLENHTLQKYYGGENAYMPGEYSEAINKAGLRIVKMLKYFDSVINYYPMKQEDWDLKFQLKKKIGILSRIKIFQRIYEMQWKLKYGNLFDEMRIPGRMYSFIAAKPT